MSTYLRILAFVFLSLVGAVSTVFSAPVVPVPGEGSGYLYFPPSLSTSSSSTKTETVGRISIFTKTTIPSGWLECNGASVSAAAYPKLVEYLAGSAAASATLPDLRGEFVRGLDSGLGVDPGRVVGTVQAGSILSHSHTGSTSTTGDHNHSGSTSSTDGAHNHGSHYSFAGNGAGSGTMSSPNRTSGIWGSWTGAGTTMSTAPNHAHTVSVTAVGDHSHTVTLGASGGAEARPRNISVIFAIRAE